MENVLDRMKRIDADRKIADFNVKMKMDYPFKKKYAELMAQEGNEFAAVSDAATKLNYIDLIQKLRKLNEEKENEKDDYDYKDDEDPQD